DQLGADLPRQGAHVLRGDGQARLGQGEGGVGERPQARRQQHDQAQGGGGVAAIIEAQRGPLGGKSPAGRRGSGRAARRGVAVAAGGASARGWRRTGQGAPQAGQGRVSPRARACCSKALARAPSVRPAAAARATCSIVSKSASRPGPPSPKARRATILPQPWARSRISWSNSGVRWRRGMACPALCLRKRCEPNSFSLCRISLSPLQSGCCPRQSASPATTLVLSETGPYTPHHILVADSPHHNPNTVVLPHASASLVVPG